MRPRTTFRHAARLVLAIGAALLLSGCIVAPPPYYHPYHYGYYGGR